MTNEKLIKPDSFYVFDVSTLDVLSEHASRGDAEKQATANTGVLSGSCLMRLLKEEGK